MKNRNRAMYLFSSAAYLLIIGLAFSGCAPRQPFFYTSTPFPTRTSVPQPNTITPVLPGFTICWENCLPIPTTITATLTVPTRTSTATPILITHTPAPEPVWLKYEDQDISFQYPKTFCGTSWQEDWDVYSCNEIWQVERTQSAYSSSDYAGGTKDPYGAYIHVLPAYSTFGFEFGGDIQIVFISGESFQEVTQGGDYQEQTTQNGYIVFIREASPQCCSDVYYLTNGDKYLEIHNYFTDRYTSYVLFLLDSIKLK